MSCEFAFNAYPKLRRSKGNSKGTVITITWNRKYLFGEKFEKKLSKITSGKQKSKTIFTGLQKSSKPTFLPSHQLYRAGPLSQNNQRRAPAGRERRASLFQELFLEEELFLPNYSRTCKYYPQKYFLKFIHP